MNDALYEDVIAAYAKSLEKAKHEFAAGGEKGAAHIADLEREIAFCAQFLPERLDEAAVREAVQAVIAEMGATDAKQAGRVIGAVVKANKGRVDPAVVKEIVLSELSRR